VVPPSNPEALGEALAELLSDPELCLELGALGRERVIRKYTLENMVASYQKVYDMLIRGARTASAGEPT
jgi:glycosyltransferase involved in cell wall biosynthesis